MLDKLDRSVSYHFNFHSKYPIKQNFLSLLVRSRRNHLLSGKKKRRNEKKSQKDMSYPSYPAKIPKQLPSCLREEHFKYLCRVLSVCLTDVCNVLGTVFMLRM